MCLLLGVLDGVVLDDALRFVGGAVPLRNCEAAVRALLYVCEGIFRELWRDLMVQGSVAVWEEDGHSSRIFLRSFSFMLTMLTPSVESTYLRNGFCICFGRFRREAE